MNLRNENFQDVMQFAGLIQLPIVSLEGIEEASLHWLEPNVFREVMVGLGLDNFELFVEKCALAP